jgi:hypothetical protein
MVPGWKSGSSPQLVTNRTGRASPDTNLQGLGNTNIGCPATPNVGCPMPTDAATNCYVEIDDTCASRWSECRLYG